jgi:type IX secretion system PorP/SprF family membrane protein
MKQYLIHIAVILCSFFLCIDGYAQQEPMYSQYMFNMSQINPAYAGNRATNNIMLLHRKQWINIDGAPSTSILSWDNRKEASNVGYGLQLYNDQLGIEYTTGFQGFYSYRLAFERSSLSMGLSGGMLNYRAAFSDALTNEGNDPLFQEDVNAWLPTVGVGALYACNEWYVGLSIPALLTTKVNVNTAQITSAHNHYFLTAGYIYQASEIIKLKPSFLMKAVKGAPLEFDINLNTWFNDVIGVGGSYRTGDAFVSMVEFQITPQFRLGYAYDYILSNLKSFNRGTHELMIRYEFNHEQHQLILSPRYY